MLPKTLNMPMENYLRLVDQDVERCLTAFVSSDEKQNALLSVIAAERSQAVDYVKEFPCEFRLTVQPQMAYRPCAGHYPCFKVKVEGEAERAEKRRNEERESRRWKIWPHMMKGLLAVLIGGYAIGVAREALRSIKAQKKPPEKIKLRGKERIC